MTANSEIQSSLAAGETHIRLTPFQLVVYSLPHMAAMCMIAPIAIVQGVYAKYYGIGLTTIAAVVLFSRIIDAVSDPLIGYCSDQYSARTGTRKPVVVLGGILVAVSGYFLFTPPDSVTVVYFACWLFAFYLAWTLFEVPHMAWASELAYNSDEKTRIFSFRAAAGYGGLLMFYGIPLLPFFESTDFTPETLRWCALAAGVLILPTLYLCMTKIPEGRVCVAARSTDQSVKLKRQHLKFLWQSIKGNRPFLLFLTAYVLFGLSLGMWYGLVFIYVDAYLGMGEQFAQMFLLAFIIGLASTPLWYKAAAKIGKKATWALGALLLLISFIYTGLLQPNNTTATELVTLKVINTLGACCTTILVPSLLSDILDYTRWKFGVNQTATYYALQVFLLKTLYAIGGAVGLALAGWYGFDPASLHHTEADAFGLLLGVAWLPAGIVLCCFMFIVITPINTRRHSLIERRLAAQENRTPG